jgi:hypothetical protein
MANDIVDGAKKVQKTRSRPKEKGRNFEPSTATHHDDPRPHDATITSNTITATMPARRHWMNDQRREDSERDCGRRQKVRKTLARPKEKRTKFGPATTAHHDDPGPPHPTTGPETITAMTPGRRHEGASNREENAPANQNDKKHAQNEIR